MARRQWVVELSDGSHTVELDHSVITGKRAIRVDGRQVALPGEDTGSVIDFGGRARVAIGESTGVVHIRTNGLTYSYDLAIDGRSVETGQSRPEPMPEEEGRSVPAWGWVAVPSAWRFRSRRSVAPYRRAWGPAAPSPATGLRATSRSPPPPGLASALRSSRAAGRSRSR